MLARGSVIGTQNTGPIFTKKDLNSKVTDPGTRMLRTIFIEKKVTWGDFKEAIMDDYRKMGSTAKKADENWQNFRSTISNNPLTSRKVNHFMLIMGFHVDEIVVKLKDNNEGGKSKYKIKF